MLNKLACQQRLERRTFARKKKDRSWRAPKHRSWEMKGQIQERMLFKLCTQLRSRKTKGAAQKAKRETGAWERELRGRLFQNKAKGCYVVSIVMTRHQLYFLMNMQSLLF